MSSWSFSLVCIPQLIRGMNKNKTKNSCRYTFKYVSESIANQSAKHWLQAGSLDYSLDYYMWRTYTVEQRSKCVAILEQRERRIHTFLDVNKDMEDLRDLFCQSAFMQGKEQ